MVVGSLAVWTACAAPAKHPLVAGQCVRISRPPKLACTRASLAQRWLRPQEEWYFKWGYALGVATMITILALWAARGH